MKTSIEGVEVDIDWTHEGNGKCIINDVRIGGVDVWPIVEKFPHLPAELVLMSHIALWA